MVAKPPGKFGFKTFAAIGLAVVLLVVFLIFGKTLMAMYNNSRLTDKFPSSKIEELYNKAQEIIVKAGGEDKAPATPQRVDGKALFMERFVRVHSNRNEVEYRLDRDHGRLSSDLRAETPEEVSLIAICKASTYKEMTADYTQIGPEHKDKFTGNTYIWVQRTEHRSSDWTETLDVQLVDLKNNRYLGRQIFVWDIERDPTSGFGEGKRDSDKLMEWYRELPVAP